MDSTFRATQSRSIISRFPPLAGIRLISALLVALLLQTPNSAYSARIEPENATEACEIHRVDLSNIVQVKPAGGIDEAGKFAAGLIMDRFSPSQGLGKTAKLISLPSDLSKVGQVYSAGSQGPEFPEYQSIEDLAQDIIIEFIDDQVSETDALLVRVNGVAVGSARLSPDASKLARTDSASVLGKGSIQLIEVDESVNDNLGLVTIGRDALTFDQDTVEQLISEEGRTVFSSPRAEDGSVYKLDYKFTTNGGDLEDIPERVLCGYSECWDAREPIPPIAGSISTNNPPVSCPPGYSTVSGEGTLNKFKFGTEYFGLGDKFLQVCELRPECGARFERLEEDNDEKRGLKDLRDGDIIALRTFIESNRKEAAGILGGLFGDSGTDFFYQSRRGGQYLGVSDIGVSVARVHVMDPNRKDAQWRVRRMTNGGFALQSVSTGLFLKRCNNCYGLRNNVLHYNGYFVEPHPVYSRLTFEQTSRGNYTVKTDDGTVLGPGAYDGEADRPDLAYPPETIGEQTATILQQEFADILGDTAGGTLFTKDFPGYKYLARAPASGNPTWKIYFKDQTEDDLVVTEDGETRKGFRNRSLEIKGGATYTLNGDLKLGWRKTLTNHGTLVIAGSLAVDSTAMIENYGTIKVQGALVVDGVLMSASGANIINDGSMAGIGQLKNEGLLENRYSFSIASVVNSGTIKDTWIAREFQSTVENTGQIYTVDRSRFGHTLTIAPYGRTVFDARLFDKSGLACQSYLGEWNAETSTCVLEPSWISPESNWVVEDGVTLDVSSRLIIDGSLISYGRVTGVENIERCRGRFTNYNDDLAYEPDNFAACTLSEQAEECLKFENGEWDDLNNVCIADGFRQVFDEENESGTYGGWSLVIPDGVTYKLPRLFPKSGEYRDEGFDITILEGGTLLTQYVGEFYLETGFVSDEIRNVSSGRITNYGTIGWGLTKECEKTGECGENSYIYMNNTFLYNFGVVGTANLGFYDAGGTTYNRCGGTINIAPRAADVFFPKQEVPCPGQDFDGDGAEDFADLDPLDPSVGLDSDGDGVADSADAFPNDPSETKDTDEDGVGDFADFFPLSRVESVDTDGDGVGDNTDFAPNDPGEWVDTDGDGVGDNSDFAPNDSSESKDTDRDGVGDNTDAFPNAITEMRYQDVSLAVKPGETDSECSLVREAFIPLLEVAAPNETVAADAMTTGVNFELAGCDSRGETLQITIDMGTTLPPNAAVYKVIGGEWTEISGATINGSIISYSITDNDGFLDQDPAIGRISDPVSVAVPVTAQSATKPNAIPTLPFLSLMALTILIALSGAASLVPMRRKI